MCNGENGLYLFIKHVIFDQIFIFRWIRSLKKPYFSLTFDWFILSTVILKIALFGHDINEKRNQKAMILEVQTNKYTREIPSRFSWPIYERLYHYWINEVTMIYAKESFYLLYKIYNNSVKDRNCFYPLRLNLSFNRHITELTLATS